MFGGFSKKKEDREGSGRLSLKTPNAMSEEFHLNKRTTVPSRSFPSVTFCPRNPRVLPRGPTRS